MLSMFSVVQANEPWWKLIVSDLPRGPGAIVGYMLIVGFVVLIWLGNRKRSE